MDLTIHPLARPCHACRLGRPSCDGSGAAHSKVQTCECRLRLQRFGLVGEADGAYENVSCEQKHGVYFDALRGSNITFYSSDSTPLSARERYAKSDGDVAVVRFGKQCSDWLMHRVFLQDVQGRTAVVFSDPVPLSDKTAWSHWSAYRQLLPLLR